MLGRLDESSPDIAVFDESFCVGNPGFLRKSNGCRDSRIRNRNHNICINLRFLSQMFTKPKTIAVEAFVIHVTIWTSEIDHLKDTQFGFAVLIPSNGLNALIVNEDHFSRFDISDEFGSDNVEPTGFGGEDILGFPVFTLGLKLS